MNKFAVTTVCAVALLFSFDVRSAEPAASSADTASVVFFRPKKLAGAAIGFIVRESGAELGKLRNGKYFVLKVQPGTHQYTVHSEAKDVLTIEAEPGETYYVMGSVGLGLAVGRPNLSPSTESAFAAAKAKLTEVAPLADDKD